MRRMVLVAGIAAVAAFATGGSATGAVSALDIGGDPEQYVVLSKQNEPALQGPRVAFLANIACTSGQRLGILVTAKQSGTGATGQGVGGIRGDCRGGHQLALVLMEKVRGSPQFRFQADQLAVEGFAVTDLKTGRLNDIEPDSSTLTPFSR